MKIYLKAYDVSEIHKIKKNSQNTVIIQSFGKD